MMEYVIKEPEDILKNEWRLLTSAIKDAKHSYHIFSISTIKNNHPELRTVVLREVNKHEKSISFHSDRRSPKYQQLIINNNVSALFYDPSLRVQLRMKGKASPVKDKDIHKNIWDDMNKASKQCYQGEIAPSGYLRNNNLINKLSKNDSLDSNHGFENFVRVRIKISEIDVLMLHHLGHRRLKCIFEKNIIKYHWIAA